MFSGLRRRAVLVAGLVASVAGLALAGAASAAAAPQPGADFLTVSSSPAGGFENLAPGDTASWFVTARSTAPVAADLTLQLRSSSTSPLLTDAAQGLRMQLTACSMAWSGGTQPSCPGTATAVAQGPLASLLGGYRLPALRAGSAAHYLARVSVPVEATNDVAGQAADLRFEITAVQGEPAADTHDEDSAGSNPARDPSAGGAASGPAPQAEAPAQVPAVHAPAALAHTGVSVASACRSLALALLAAGSLVLVLRRVGAN